MIKKKKTSAFVQHFALLKQWISLFFYPNKIKMQEVFYSPLAKDGKKTNRAINIYLISLILISGIYTELTRINTADYFKVGSELVLILSLFLLWGLFMGYIGIIHWLATGWLGGRNTRTRITLSLGSVNLIAYLISILLSIPFILSKYFSLMPVSSLDPWMSWINYFLYGYTGFLNIKTVKFVYKFGYFRALFTVLLAVLILGIVAFVIIGIGARGIDDFILLK